MEYTIEEQLRMLFRRIAALEMCVFFSEGDAELQKRCGILEDRIASMAGEIRSTVAFANELDGIAARVRDIELRDQADRAAGTIASLPLRADNEAGESKWGIGDIIFSADKVETRKSLDDDMAPTMCAWFEDLDDAKSLALHVSESVRFDPLTLMHTVTFVVTKVM